MWPRRSVEQRPVSGLLEPREAAAVSPQALLDLKGTLRARKVEAFLLIVLEEGLSVGE